MQHTQHRGALLLTTLALLTPLLPAEDWTRFRGPNGTGIVHNQKLPVKWTKANVLWKAKTFGVGKSSPIVCKGKLFFQSATKNGKARIVICMDAKTGKMVWKKELTGSRAHTHPLNTLASSTLAADGERVYAAVWDGSKVSIYAWTLDGTLEWSKPLGRFRSEHGPASSPMVHEGKVILAFDQDKSSSVIALEAKTGKQLWQTPRKAFRASYSVPFLLEKSNQVELIVASSAGITAYDPNDGKVIRDYVWMHPGKVLRTVASPIYAEGLIFAHGGNGGGDRHLIAVKAEGKGDITEGGLVWEAKKSFPYVPTMLAHGKYVFSVHDNGIAHCHEAATGKEIWEKRLSGKVSASPVMVDGKIYVVTERGTVHVFASTTKFKELAKNAIDDSVFATPAVANGCMFIRGDEHVFCIGTK